MKTPIEQVIAATFGISPGAVTDTLEFNAIPEWDSLNHVNLMLALESEYSIEVDEERMIELTNVRAIRDFLNEEGVSS